MERSYGMLYTLLIGTVILGACAAIGAYKSGQRHAERECGKDLAKIECEARKQGCLMGTSDETSLRLECIKLGIKGCSKHTSP